MGPIWRIGSVHLFNLLEIWVTFQLISSGLTTQRFLKRLPFYQQTNSTKAATDSFNTYHTLTNRKGKKKFTEVYSLKNKGGYKNAYRWGPPILIQQPKSGHETMFSDWTNRAKGDWNFTWVNVRVTPKVKLNPVSTRVTSGNTITSLICWTKGPAASRGW